MSIINQRAIVENLTFYDRQNLIWDCDCSPKEKLVLFALNMHADSNGECYPGLKRIEQKCRIIRADRITDRLVQMGFIAKKQRFDQNGRQTSNGYQILFGKLGEVDVRSRGDGCDIQGEVDVRSIKLDHKELDHLKGSKINIKQEEEKEKKERKRSTPSPLPEIVDCEILEEPEPEPIENPSSSLAIYSQSIARSENKTVPAAARGKKAIETDHVARLCAAWNEHKATLWASIRIPPNPTRSRSLLKFVESCGSIDTAIEYLTGALTYMRDDEFWASKKLLTIENILSNNKISQNYEKYMELQENPAIVAVAEKLKQMQEPKSFQELQWERDKRAGEQAVINRMKLGNPGEFSDEQLAEYRSKYPNEFKAVS